MGAPAGNRYWKLREKHGRNKIYETPDDFFEAACDYFEWCDGHPWLHMEQSRVSRTRKIEELLIENDKQPVENNSPIIGIPIQRPYTLEGLCIHIGISTQTFYDYEKRKDFIEIITHVRDIIYNQKFEGATVGAFNASIIARDLQLVDKKSIDGEIGVYDTDGARHKLAKVFNSFNESITENGIIDGD